MSYSDNAITRSFVYWDTDGAGTRAIAAFQPVCLADASEVAAALAAGVRDAIIGRLVVRVPVGTLSGVTTSTRRCVGVTIGPAFSGQEVGVVTDGVAEVMVNAAVAVDACVFAVVNEARTNAQTPITNLSETRIPLDPRATLSYQLALIDDPAPTLATGGAAVLHFPIGYALQASTAKYDVIPVELARTPIYL